MLEKKGASSYSRVTEKGMNCLIVGYGRMGREVETILSQRNHTVVARIDSFDNQADSPVIRDSDIEAADMAIEFSLADGVLKNAEMYTAGGLSAVVGTTGWEKDREGVKDIVSAGDTGYLWGSNFSIGAHLFFSLARRAAVLVDSIPEYDILAYEIHHNKKKDSPSGTALVLGKEILENSTRKTSIVTDKLDRAPEPEELHIASVRGGSVPGTHSIMLDSLADTIEIKHTARNRSGFALGSVMAAEWLAGKQGFFQVDDFINDIIPS